MVAMCMMCDGCSAEEVNQWFQEAIERHGGVIDVRP